MKIRTQMEARRQSRIPCKATAALRWYDDRGDPHYTFVRVLNISELGAGVESPQEVAARSYVHILLEASGFSAYGVVRHSSRRGLLGIEFNPATICHPRDFKIEQLGVKGGQAS